MFAALDLAGAVFTRGRAIREMLRDRRPVLGL